MFLLADRDHDIPIQVSGSRIGVPGSGCDCKMESCFLEIRCRIIVGLHTWNHFLCTVLLLIYLFIYLSIYLFGFNALPESETIEGGL